MCDTNQGRLSAPRSRRMWVNAIWKLLFVNALFYTAVAKPGQIRNKNISDSRYGTSSPYDSSGLPEFVDSNRMKQTFIAWPAQHSFRLKCKARGQPPLTYQWLKNGDPAFHRRLQPSLRTNMWSLKLKDLISDDSGKYTCVVSNKYGSINHTYTLRVVEKSRTKPILRCEHPRNTTARLGGNATLSCVVVESGTLPDFRWLKWHSIPEDYPNFSLNKVSYSLVSPRFYRTIRVEKHFGVLVTIVNVTEEDFGLYTCYVSNHLGSAHKSAFLNKVTDTTTTTAIYRTSSTTSSKISESPTTSLDFKPDEASEQISTEPQVSLRLFIAVLVGWTTITVAFLALCLLRAKRMNAKQKFVESDL